MTESGGQRNQWGKAGQRLTAQERRRRGLARIRGQQRGERDLKLAHTQWERGELIPARITMALDLHSLYGPEVDEACGAAEPDVDRWEAGELYPTWQQVLLLSDLTGLLPKFFFLPMSDVPLWTTLDFHMPSTEPRKPPVLRFKPEAFTADPTPIQGRLL